MTTVQNNSNDIQTSNPGGRTDITLAPTSDDKFAKSYTLTVTLLKNGIDKLYQVIDEEGKVISKRKSARDYVAATIDSGNYFGRVDLAARFVSDAYSKYHETHIIAYLAATTL